MKATKERKKKEHSLRTRVSTTQQTELTVVHKEAIKFPSKQYSLSGTNCMGSIAWSWALFFLFPFRWLGKSKGKTFGYLREEISHKS